MIDDRHEELAALYALDLLEGEEKSRFEAELGADSDLQRLVASLRNASTGIAHAAPEATPPDALKARILATAAQRTRPATAAPRSKVIAFPSLLPWLAAAGFGIAAMWAGSHYLEARDENRALREQQRLADAAMDSMRGELDKARSALADSGRQLAELASKLKAEGDLDHFKIATLASMLGNTPEALAVAVWDPAKEEGILTVSKLPALAKDKDYQLWVVDTQYPSPVNGGVFVVDPVTGEAHVKFRGDKPIRSIAKFAVSLERKGGVPLREGPIVLLSR